VGVDLRDDWAAALEAAGFDRTRPTVWIAEGLLPYLPAEAEERLFDLLHPRCAPGSRIAFEHIPAANVAELAETFRTTEAGKQVGMDTNQLLSLEPRRDPGEWLAGQGWQVRSERAADLVHRFGASAPGEHASKLAKGAIVTADLPK
jgi:methyltransferase (TIGR00027 family)